MRLATVRTAAATRVARIDGDVAVMLDIPDVLTLLSQPGWRDAASVNTGERVPVQSLQYAPLVRPRKVICVGLNYRGHVIETGNKVPSSPTLFNKFDDSLCGAHDDIVLPPESTRVDWEGELTIVIGPADAQPVRRVSETDARSVIAGYTIANDVSMRDWQRRTTQFLAGKAWDASTPIGPWLTTGDELDPAVDLAITTKVNDEVVQDSRTNDLIFGIDLLVADISTFTTLYPGDVILTGTPGGVGDARTPPRYLQPGDICEVSIESLGSLRNRFVAA
jgi:acylpyruvate hydrolase